MTQKTTTPTLSKRQKYATLSLGALLVATSVTGANAAPPSDSAPTAPDSGFAVEQPVRAAAADEAQLITPTNFTITKSSKNPSVHAFDYFFDLTGLSWKAGDKIRVQVHLGDSDNVNVVSIGSEQGHDLGGQCAGKQGVKAGVYNESSAKAGTYNPDLEGRDVYLNASTFLQTEKVSELRDPSGVKLADIRSLFDGIEVVMTEESTKLDNVTMSFSLLGAPMTRMDVNRYDLRDLDPKYFPEATFYCNVGEVTREEFHAMKNGGYFDTVFENIPHSIYVNGEKAETYNATVTQPSYLKRTRSFWTGNLNQVVRPGEDKTVTGGRLSFGMTTGKPEEVTREADVNNRQTMEFVLDEDTREYLKIRGNKDDVFNQLRMTIRPGVKLGDTFVDPSNEEWNDMLAERGIPGKGFKVNEANPYDVVVEEVTDHSVKVSYVPKHEGDSISFNISPDNLQEGPYVVQATAKAVQERKTTGYNYKTTWSHTDTTPNTSKNLSRWFFAEGESIGDLKPKAEPDTSTTPFQTEVSKNLLENDKHPGGEITNVELLEIGGDGAVENGTVTVDPETGEAKFTPKAGFVGTQVIKYRITDENGLTSESTWTVTVEAPPAPVIKDDTFEVDFNSADPVRVNLTGNDGDFAQFDADSIVVGVNVDSDDDYAEHGVGDTFEDANFTYSIEKDDNGIYLVATPKPGRVGQAPSIEYTLADKYGQLTNTANITGTIKTPVTSVAIESTVNDKEADTVTPDQDVTVKHVVTNTSKYPYPAGTVITITDGGTSTEHTLPNELAPGQTYEFTTTAQVEKKKSKTVTSNVNVVLNTVDATTGESKDITAGATDAVTITAKTGLIDLVDDHKDTIFNEDVTVDLFGNDTQEDGFPFLDDTFVMADGDNADNPGVVSEDGRSIEYSNGTWTYEGNGRATWKYKEGTTVVAVPSFTYNVSNALGDTTDPAVVTVDAKTVAPTVENDTFTGQFNGKDPIVVNVLENDTIPVGDEVKDLFLVNDAGERVKTLVTDHGTYTIDNEGKVTITDIPEGLTGAIPAVKYVVVDKFDNVAEGSVAGSIDAPVTSTDIVSYIGESGVTEATVQPGENTTVSHVITNTSDFVYTVENTVITINGEEHQLIAPLAPGESVTITTDHSVDQRSEKTITDSVKVTLVAKTADGADASVSAEDSSEVKLVAKTGTIALENDENTINAGGSTEGNLFENDTPEDGHPFLDDTFKWIIPEGVDGTVSEDGKTVEFENAIVTYDGEGKYTVKYKDDAKSYALPPIQYTVSNDLGDTPEAPATLTLKYRSVDVEVSIKGEDGQFHDADDADDPVLFTDKGEREIKYTISNNGQVPLTEVKLTNGDGEEITVELDQPLEPGQSVDVTVTKMLDAGVYKDTAKVVADGVEDTDDVNAKTTVPEPVVEKPAPEAPKPAPVIPEKKLEPKPVEKNVTNTGANVFGSVAGGNLGALLFGLMTLLGGAGVMLRERLADIIVRAKELLGLGSGKDADEADTTE